MQRIEIPGLDLEGLLIKGPGLGKLPLLVQCQRLMHLCLCFGLSISDILGVRYFHKYQVATWMCSGGKSA